MKIGFLISGVGIFGSVREIVECGNVFIKNGHECYIFNPEKESIDWINFLGNVKFENKINEFNLDVLILTTTPNSHYNELFLKSNAKKKVFCMMGFDQNINPFETNKHLVYLMDKCYIMADGLWQIETMKFYYQKANYIYSQLGGINLEMFKPVEKEKREKLIIGWSGDLRNRKGGTTLKSFFEKNKIHVETYFNKGIPQDKMKDWFSGIDIFVDNHHHGGWCNPVAEAMSCGVPVICSRIKCNESFAIERDTCMKFEFNDFYELDTVLKIVKDSEILRNRIKNAGLEKIKTFDYNLIGQKLLNEFKQL